MYLDRIYIMNISFNEMYRPMLNSVKYIELELVVMS